MSKETFVFVVCFLCGGLAGSLATVRYIKKTEHREAIAHGAATYVIENGSPVFKWNDEVKK